MATWRHLRKKARKAGATKVSSGSSEIWELPGGQRIKLDARHPNQQVRTSVCRLIEKAIADAAPSVPDSD